ncbi:S-DNA-T family DNA segregation ATPase FtsK/SpoIIIE [Sediminihabitans luteus]|uniref:S-DNA-T family DNA segregation ATPase FtsK/SpoIIIE n=1 Tax=Sediminihabitans luteus TaxID=1138585 RepID=A0A2M9CZE2_9CELL|nr:FtsK/SpoIIIE domain-containing protein [Sediminihabitans luteus]PJJ77312.1 S-DNA-T family DNA segregation ATPase FtsK/SpoIIIE [Sediminihabitans luteus]GII98763.1 cell division protein FtsK [Sediminihabitans luteus]
MRLKVTLVRADHSSDDLVVTADAATTIGEVARTVATRDPRAVPGTQVPPQLTLHAQLPGQDAPVLLPPDAALGEAWIGSGARLSLVDHATYRSSVVTDRTPRASVRVVEGPDAGRSVDLPEGSYVVGRAPGVDLILSDRLASKRHARIDIGDTIEIVDLGSANGVVADGASVTRLRVEQAVTVQIGDTFLVVEPHAARATAGVVAKAGPVPFNRSPKVEPRYPGETFTAPEPPREEEEQTFPFLALLAPVLLGVSMFAMTGRVSSLMIVLMSPLMLIGSHITSKQRAKRRLAKAIARFDERLETLRDALATEETLERSARLVEAPATPLVYAEAMRRGPVLWTRRPEHWSFLNVRFGTGTMPTRCTVDTPGKGELLAEFQERLDDLLAKHTEVSGVPVVENLHDAGAIGLAGDQQHLVGPLNALLVQLTALHSPAELVVAAMVSPYWTSSLRWLTWLPHTSSAQSPIEGTHLADSAGSAGALVAQLEEIVRVRLAERRGAAARRGAIREDDAALDRGADVSEGKVDGTQSPLPAIVVVVSGDVDVDRSRLAQLAEAGADAGVFPIWVGADVASLPAACRTYVQVSATGARVGLVRLGRTIDDLVPEVVEPDAALEYARRMAPVFDAGALVEDSSDIPRSVSLVTLLGHEMAESSDAVVDRWRQNRSLRDRTQPPTRRKAGSLRAIVGSAGVDPMQLDLRTQGPHALVGGTTGSGKSEFLQAWVLGMAAEYSPDRVTFLFVDYKGGSAFAECTNLPHCVGLVTDLSQHLVRRALTSLRAELHHREHLFNRKKAKDLLELEKRGDPDAPPALVIVIDEFAALVGDVPEFVDGVVDVAQRGRSLGIHLVMATQRPAGVIKDNLRANTNLRIALRMADESDSSDVVGVPDAAHFDPGIPGRGVAKSGPGRLQVFQSAYAGGWTTAEQQTAGIEVAALRFGGEVRWEEPEGTVVEIEDDLGPNDQERLVRTIVAAAKHAQVEPPRRPWLDELATAYDLLRLRQRTDAELLVGVADLPQVQAQEPIYFRPDVDGNLAVYGTGGAGKSTVLRTLGVAAGITPRGGPVHVYGLDFAGGSLRMLESLPHVGSVVMGDDVERVVRLLRMLRSELDRRGPLFAEASASSISEYRALTGNVHEPRILLLVDGFGGFRDDFESGTGRAAWFDVFRDVLAEGRQLGIHVALTADRAGAVPTAVRSAVQRNVVLRLSDDSYGLLDVPGDVLTPASPPGRAVVDGAETQVAVVGGTTSVAEQARACARLGESMRRAGVAQAPRVGALPREYTADVLPGSTEGLPVLGIGDETLGPVGWAPQGTFLVSGPVGSGRTTALAALARSLVRAVPGVRLVLAGRPGSPLLDAVAWERTAHDVDAVAALAQDVAQDRADAPFAIFVEGVDEYLQSAADAPLVALMKAAQRGQGLVVAEAESSGWSSPWPLLAEMKNGRRGLLLQPEAMDGDALLKTSLPRVSRAEFPPGRGYYVARGAVTRVQVPVG